MNPNSHGSSIPHTRARAWRLRQRPPSSTGRICRCRSPPVMSLIDPRNVASIAVAERLGARWKASTAMPAARTSGAGGATCRGVSSDTLRTEALCCAARSPKTGLLPRLHDVRTLHRLRLAPEPRQGLPLLRRRTRPLGNLRLRHVGGHDPRQRRGAGPHRPWTPPDWPEPEVGWMVLSAAPKVPASRPRPPAPPLPMPMAVSAGKTVVSYIGLENVRSIRLAEKLGAVLDPDAPQPKPDDPVLVYRHPVPGGAS